MCKCKFVLADQTFNVYKYVHIHVNDIGCMVGFWGSRYDIAYPLNTSTSHIFDDSSHCTGIYIFRHMYMYSEHCQL